MQRHVLVNLAIAALMLNSAGSTIVDNMQHRAGSEPWREWGLWACAAAALVVAAGAVARRRERSSLFIPALWVAFLPPLVIAELLAGNTTEAVLGIVLAPLFVLIVTEPRTRAWIDRVTRSPIPPGPAATGRAVAASDGEGR